MPTEISRVLGSLTPEPEPCCPCCRTLHSGIPSPDWTHRSTRAMFKFDSNLMSFENSVSLSKVCFLLFRLRPGVRLRGMMARAEGEDWEWSGPEQTSYKPSGFCSVGIHIKFLPASQYP